MNETDNMREWREDVISGLEYQITELQSIVDFLKQAENKKAEEIYNHPMLTKYLKTLNCNWLIEDYMKYRTTLALNITDTRMVDK